VQRLRFVPPWLKDRCPHTYTDTQHINQLIWKAQPAEMKNTKVVVISERLRDKVVL